MGFTLDADGRRVLVERDRRNAERIFEYLGGREVNSHPCQSFERYVICFADMELDEALRWPDLIAIVRDKVKPERDRLRDNPDGRRRKQYWWQFGRWTPALYSLLAGRSTCLVTARTSKHVMFSRQPTHRIFSENLVVFLFDSGSAFSALQSRVHAAWVALTSSTLESRQGYRPSDCFETFPLPPTEALVAGGPLDQAGRALYDARAAFMQSTNQGLTTTYNLLKDPDVDDPAIVALRALHLELDRAVLAAYGWADIPVPAYTDPVTDADWKAREAFEDELIDRLFALNATRATAERLLGPTPSTKSPKPPKPKKPKPTSPEGGAVLVTLRPNGQRSGRQGAGVHLNRRFRLPRTTMIGWRLLSAVTMSIASRTWLRASRLTKWHFSKGVVTERAIWKLSYPWWPRMSAAVAGHSSARSCLDAAPCLQL
jgi:hypothetical protein